MVVLLAYWWTEVSVAKMAAEMVVTWVASMVLQSVDMLVVMRVLC